MKNEGELLILMDGNAKIGLLGEEISRNGRLLKQVFDLTELSILNESVKCRGSITRRNTKNDSEFSAIDFILANNSAKEWINDILIDEAGLFKVRGKNETDHNTICINLTIPKVDKIRNVKQVSWNIRAPEEKWVEFRQELDKRSNKASNIIFNKNLEINHRYAKWFNEIDTAARSTIGKTTFRTHTRKKPSKEAKELRKS